MEAFSTVERLEASLGREFDANSLAMANQALEDASTELRAQIGQHIWPRATVTFAAVGPSVDLPQHPVVSVDAVTDTDGNPVPYDVVDGTVWADGRLLVTFTYGHADPPADLERWCRVLAAQQIMTVEMNLGLSAGGLSSVSIDDFRAAWADAGEQSGVAIPQAQVDRLRERYAPGGGTAVVGMR